MDIFVIIILLIVIVVLVFYSIMRHKKESYLINKYLKTKNQEDGRKVLSFLLKNFKFFTIQELIKSGLDINLPDKTGNTALTKAAQKGDYYTIKFLIENGANADNLPNDMALLFACEKGKYGQVKSLIKKGTDVNISYNIPDFYNNDIGYNPGIYGITPLILSCLVNKLEIAKILLENNAKVNTKDSKGRTPLSIAMKNNNPEMVELLKSYGAKE